MGFFTKRADPLTERARDLQAELAAVQEEIERLESGALPTTATPKFTSGQPRLRSTALPGGARVVVHGGETAACEPAVAATPAAPAPRREPVLEEVSPRPLPEAPVRTGAAHYNELGVRKFDFSAWAKSLRDRLSGNPGGASRILPLLNAGALHGARPLRREQRVARNRFLALFAVLLLVLFGLFVAVLKQF
jgi:hypothetical protein